ncbi:Alpha/Beta hydrolase protein [Chytridium lagenaria]|nr:Alpha/Beta hydrolase protein [Chytridium lagenaria]
MALSLLGIFLILAVAETQASSPIPNAADFYVDSLPGLNGTENHIMHAGLVTVNETTEAKLFFWLVEAADPGPDRKLTLWLNGGPGCSSMDGMFLENGLFRAGPNGEYLMKNEYSWHHGSSVIFLDQPVGTGYSSIGTGTYTSSMDTVVAHLLEFMDKFYLIFPHLRRAELYIAGESFAGVVIPYFAQAVFQRNEIQTTKRYQRYKLSGLIISSGWMDPIRQYSSYFDYAMANKLIETPESCGRRSLHKQGEKIKVARCEKILEYILDLSREGTALICMIFGFGDDTPDGGCGLYSWPPYLKEMHSYLSRSDVRQALHVPQSDERWRECSSPVTRALAWDPSPPSYKLLPYLLEKTHLICNVIGMNWMVGNLTWNGATGMQDSPILQWVINGAPAGTYQSARNLTNFIMYNGSHMAPVDHPRESLDVLNRMIRYIDGVTPYKSELLDPSNIEAPTGISNPTPPAKSNGNGFITGLLGRRQSRSREEDASSNQWHQLSSVEDDVLFNEDEEKSGENLLRQSGRNTL